MRIFGVHQGCAALLKGNSMKIYGITGGSGAGKSEISALFKKRGACVIDADIIARQVVENGKPAIEEIKKEWPQVVTNGALDRKALAQIVFNDSRELHKLNSITHKYIIDEIKNILSSKKSDTYVIDAIALIESGLGDMCHIKIAVIANKDTRIERIMKRDNLTKAQAESRINAQMSDSFYIENSDYTIYNDEDKAKLDEKIGRIIKGS